MKHWTVQVQLPSYSPYLHMTSFLKWKFILMGRFEDVKDIKRNTTVQLNRLLKEEF